MQRWQDSPTGTYSESESHQFFPRALASLSLRILPGLHGMISWTRRTGGVLLGSTGGPGPWLGPKSAARLWAHDRDPPRSR